MNPDFSRIPLAVVQVLLAPEATQSTLVELMEAFIQALGASVHLSRTSWSVPLLHPELRSAQVIWTEGSPVREVGRRWGAAQEMMYQRSPMRPLYEGETHLIRHRILPEDGPRPYEILDELATAGFTDYVAAAAPASVRWERTLVTWATRTPGGFTDQQLDILQALLPLLTLVLRVHAQKRQTRMLLHTYLGADAAARVLDGHIRRGDVVDIEAAVCFCDLRNFTSLSQQLSQEDLLALLDDAFGAVVGPVDQERGDVLKFIGDAVLAVFRADDHEASRRDVAARAVRAALQAMTNAQAVDAQRRAAGRAPLSIGLSIHLGRVAYGNIGSPTRLDFTVIGPAVNLASRLEGLCRVLDQPIVMSGEVASRISPEILGNTRLIACGTHALKGIPEAVEVWGLRLEIPLASAS